MKKSIITDTECRCFLCGRWGENLETHHCLHGSANRKLADEDGLTVKLCHRCHRLLHDEGVGDRELQIIAEETWMEHFRKTVEDFIKRYGKNYLYEEE